MKIDYKKLIFLILIPLIVGIISALLTKNGMSNFDLINKPSFAPKKILFPIVWTILYILMGISSYLIYVNEKIVNKDYELFLYFLQLSFNFFWSIIFFNLKWYLFSFIWLIIMFIIILIITFKFYKINKYSSYLLIPYCIWVLFALVLNFSIYLLN